MKTRIAVGLGAVLALALAVTAWAAPAAYKVTGGGQVIASADSSSVKGPGDTITFQAFSQSTDANAPATGQVNIVDRAGTGTGGVHFKGTVECATISPAGADGGGYAELKGTGQTKDGTTSRFIVRIMDNGQGSAADADMVEFDRNTDLTCSDDPQSSDVATYLGRGNAKIHKQNPSTTKSKSSGSTASSTSSTSALSALGLR